MPNYGHSGSAPFVANLFTAKVIGTVFNAPGANLWAHTFHARGGKATGTNTAIRMAIYNTDSNKNPTTRRGYSAQMSFTAELDQHGVGGQEISGAVSVSDDGPTNTAIPLNANQRYMIAIHGSGADARVRMQEAANPALNHADNKQLYVRSGSASPPPPDPFGSFSASIEGHLALWVEAETNVSPTKPANLSPSGTINDLVPTFTAPFVDANSDRGDYLRQFCIQVRRVSDGQIMWNATLTATSAERAAATFSRTYGGSTLSRGEAYEWRCQMSDHFNTWSQWSDEGGSGWTAFTVADLGFLTPVGPTGKIETQTPDFVAKWTHQSATSLTEVRARITTVGGVVMQTGAWANIEDVNSSSPPGTEFTFDWEDTGLSPLPLGQTVLWQMQGDDGSAFSDWSSPTSISINAPPSVPTFLSPWGGQAMTNYPVLRCQATDPDDSVATGLQVFARIKEDDGTLIATREMTFNASISRWEYQTDGDDLEDYGTYRWDAYSYDGTYYSGGAITEEANAVTSPEATFQYLQGSAVTITSPAAEATIDTASFTLSWTVSPGTQTHRRIYLYEAGTETLAYVFPSPIQLHVTSSNTFVVPAGSYRNKQSYDVQVFVRTDPGAIDSFSERVPIHIDYEPAPSVTNLQAVAVPIGDDPWPTAIRVSWDQTLVGIEDGWQLYRLVRTAASGPDAGSQIVADISSPLVLEYTDHDVVSGVEYTYRLTQWVSVGLDQVESLPSEATASVTLQGAVLHDIREPNDTRLVLTSVQDRSETYLTNQVELETWGGGPPWIYESGLNATILAVEAQLYRPANGAADFVELSLEHFRRLRGYRADNSPVTVCYRDERGRRVYGRVREPEITDRRLLRGDVAFEVWETMRPTDVAVG